MSIRLIVAFFFGMVGFILTLLVTISVTVVKSIYLLRINSNGSGAAVSARIGAFGACVYGSTSGILGLTSTGDGSCTHAAVGYTLDPTVFGVNVPSHASSIVNEGLSKALVLNAIACGVAGLGIVLGMAVLCCSIKHAESALRYALGISHSLAILAFWLDLIVVLLARQRVGDYTDGEVSGHIGNALWLAFGAEPKLSPAIKLTHTTESPSYRNIDHPSNSKQSYRPNKSNMSLRGMKQAITFPAFFLTLVGFILVLLVTLSVPIIHSINMIHASQTVTGSSSSLGVFGACYTQAQNFGTGAAYTINNAYFGTTQTIAKKGLAGGLVMNVIACGFAGVAFIFGLLGWLLRNRALMVLLFIFVLLAAFFEWIAFWINLGFVLNTRSNISRDTGGLWTGHIGNAFWLSLGSALALSFATCFAGVSSFSEEERRDRDATNVRPVPQVHEKPGRRWPWQKRRNSATASEVAPVTAYPANAGV